MLDTSASTEMEREDTMPAQEEKAPRYCERCDTESQHFIKFIGTDNQPHYVCWSCLSREEKRINLKETWKRGRRAR